MERACVSILKLELSLEKFRISDANHLHSSRLQSINYVRVGRLEEAQAAAQLKFEFVRAVIKLSSQTIMLNIGDWIA